MEPGEFRALLGPNGAGKSTAIGIICGLVRKTSGKVSVFGYDLDGEELDARRLIGVVPQEFNFGNFEKVGDIISTQAGFYGLPFGEAKDRTEACLELLELQDKMQVQARMLSGGMKRRLMVARALVHGPRMLILDEPTAGVDVELRRSMWEFLTRINESGITVVLTTHYLEEAERLCRYLSIIDHGEIVEDGPMEKVLRMLDHVVYVVRLVQAPAGKVAVPKGMRVTKAEGDEVWVSVPLESDLQELLEALAGGGHRVRGIRESNNRLEQLFLSRTLHEAREAPA